MVLDYMPMLHGTDKFADKALSLLWILRGGEFTSGLPLNVFIVPLLSCLPTRDLLANKSLRMFFKFNT